MGPGEPPWSDRGLGGFILTQLLFTGTPPMQPLFDCRSVDIAAGLLRPRLAAAGSGRAGGASDEPGCTGLGQEGHFRRLISRQLLAMQTTRHEQDRHVCECGHSRAAHHRDMRAALHHH